MLNKKIMSDEEALAILNLDELSIVAGGGDGSGVPPLPPPVGNGHHEY